IPESILRRLTMIERFLVGAFGFVVVLGLVVTGAEQSKSRQKSKTESTQPQAPREETTTSDGFDEKAGGSGSSEKAKGTPEIAQATFGGGCFWCMEAVFERLPGVKSVVSGYAGGHVPNPTYE